MNTKSKSTLEKLESILSFKNYADNTIKIYLHYAGIFLLEFDCDIYHISQSKAVDHLIGKKYSSHSEQSQYISSVKSLYRYIVGCKMDRFKIERPRKQKSLPKVIDKNLMISAINSIENTKHKSIIMLAYSTGMRVSEVINLEIKDIDSDRMIIFIRNSKGNKDRYVRLTQKVLDTLRLYYRSEKPYKYLFNGKYKLQYTASSCNKIVKKYLGEKHHFHQIRHSNATAMLEAGTDLRVIQKHLGHASSKSTEIYTHVSNDLLQNANQPI